MNVLIIGGGGREHAMAWKARQSSKVDTLYCTPGNAGIAEIADIIDISASDYRALAAFALSHKVDLTIVGPEAPLCGGIVNAFHAQRLRIFGPDSRGAQLEGSKVYAKEFMRTHGIPTAGFVVCDTYQEACDHIRKKNGKCVVKADGLAAGKGVTVCHSVTGAEAAAHAALEEGIFGDAGRRIVIEDLLTGEEASILALVDGRHILPLVTSQDHKAVFDNDEGPNTGGMGAYSPAPVVTARVQEKIMRTILEPTLLGLQKERIDYRGVIYVGVMINGDDIHVLEYNVRFGDPETQAILMRLQSDFIGMCRATVDGRLSETSLTWDPRPAVCVVMAAGGYPSHYHKHDPITGIADADAMPGVQVFHAGTCLRHGELVTAGGRVLGVTALGADIPTAIETAYSAVERIHFRHAHFRWDIGAKAL